MSETPSAIETSGTPGLAQIRGSANNPLGRKRDSIPIEARILIEDYTAKKRLRPRDKTKIKRIISYWQGYDGKIARCELCNDTVPVDIKDLTVHHPDENPSNNDIYLLMVAHHACNSSEHQRTRASANLDILTDLKKENMTDGEIVAKATSERLLKEAPTTFQKSKQYKQQALVYLLQYVRDSKVFDVVVADIEAITGCSHNKAIEYLNGYSLSGFAPFRQWISQNGQYIAPREGWDAAKYGTEEYKAALAILGKKAAGGQE